MIQQKPTIITEGKTKVFVYIQKDTKTGPGAKMGIPFYNQSMELNRDSSLLLAQWLIDVSKKPVEFLDGLAATGIRGIRFANELTGEFSIHINERDDKSFKLIEKNIKEYPSANIIVTKDNLHHILATHRFDYIDIDPFGSPVEFLDGAMRSIRHNGVIAATATDKAALCGVYPQVCLRRYGAWPLHGFLMQEIGIRILLAVICREAAKYNKGIQPLWSYSTDHFFRLYIQILNGKKYVNESIKNFKLLHSQDLPLSDLFPNQIVGPIWNGSLHKLSVLEHMQKSLLHMKLGTQGIQLSSLQSCIEETELPAFFYSTEAAAHLYKISPPKVIQMISRLTDAGYVASHCTFSPYGFRTNAPTELVETMFQK